MNARKRKSIQEAISLLEKAAAIVEAVYDQESDAVINYPENLQSTETYEKMEDAVANMEEASVKIDEAKECLDDAVSKIGDALEYLQDAAG